MPAVPIPAALPGTRSPGAQGAHGNSGAHGLQARPGLTGALTQALAALFAAGALTDLTPFLRQGRAGRVSGSTLASRTVPRMRAAEPLAPARPAGAGPRGAVRLAAERETRPVR